MTYEPTEFWTAHGPFIAGPGAASPEHVEAETILGALLPSLGPIADVLDVGCGRGRLAGLLADVLPDAHYSGIDIGEAQVAATQLVRPEGDLYHSSLQDFTPGRRRWDLVLVSEVLMHIPPEDIEAAVLKLVSLSSRWIVAVEWTEPVPPPIAEWNWIHDYRALFGSVHQAIPTNLQTVFVVRR